MNYYVLSHSWSDSSEVCDVAGQEMSINMEGTEKQERWNTCANLLKPMGLHEYQGRTRAGISPRGQSSGREDAEHSTWQGTDLDAAGAFCRLKDSAQDVCSIAPTPEQRAAAQMINGLKQDSFPPPFRFFFFRIGPQWLHFK